jgi:hypothetical protein
MAHANTSLRTYLEYISVRASLLFTSSAEPGCTPFSPADKPSCVFEPSKPASNQLRMYSTSRWSCHAATQAASQAQKALMSSASAGCRRIPWLPRAQSLAASARTSALTFQVCALRACLPLRSTQPLPLAQCHRFCGTFSCTLRALLAACHPLRVHPQCCPGSPAPPARPVLRPHLHVGASARPSAQAVRVALRSHVPSMHARVRRPVGMIKEPHDSWMIHVESGALYVPTAILECACRKSQRDVGH